MKEHPILFNDAMVRAILDGRKFQTRRLANGPTFPSSIPWQPGDVLWVRECFWVRQWGNTFDGIGVDYRAGGPPLHLGSRPENVGKMCCWRPSIHMPRWACRLFLDVTRVRCERLQDISEADAIAEGSQCAGVPASLTNRGAFAKLWDSLYGNHPGCDWAANPWVFVIEFEKRKG
jgi:hypothetical protein